MGADSCMQQRSSLTGEAELNSCLLSLQLGLLLLSQLVALVLGKPQLLQLLQQVGTHLLLLLLLLLLLVALQRRNSQDM